MTIAYLEEKKVVLQAQLNVLNEKIDALRAENSEE
jgi:hypothetical protein